MQNGPSSEDGYNFSNSGARIFAGVLRGKHNLTATLARLSDGERLLLAMAGLPLLDGVFLRAVTGGAVADPAAAISFGVSVFSGAGCIAAATMLEGSFVRRLVSWATVYGLVTLGAGATVAWAPVMHSYLVADFHFFSALILLGLALGLVGFNLKPTSAPPSTLVGEWTWPIRIVTMPKAILSVALAASLLRLVAGLTSSPQTLVDFEPKPGIPMLAVLAGSTFTLGGVVLSSLVKRLVDPQWARRGGAIALVCIASAIVGLPAPSASPMVALCAALVAGGVRRLQAHRFEAWKRRTGMTESTTAVLVHTGQGDAA